MGNNVEATIPKHVAVIMDGNGRWAQARGKERWEGHQAGAEAVRRVIQVAGEMGVEFLTLYAFSKENWRRPKEEVDLLMELMVTLIAREAEELMKNKVRVKAIGNLVDLPVHVREKLQELIQMTSGNTGLTVIIALSYGSRWEIVQAAKKIAANYRQGKITDLESIGESDFSEYLTTQGIPDPDLLIRTSGEYRVSNFLLWQIAYAELYFIDKFWPDFEKEDLYLAIRNFQQRERRFGKTGEQLKK